MLIDKIKEIAEKKVKEKKEKPESLNFTYRNELEITARKGDTVIYKKISKE